MSVQAVNQSTGALSPIAGGTLYADAPIGAIYPYGGSTAPQGFLICDGTAVSRTTYAALFAVIGTSFGSGDGSTTFNIPDLRGEFLRGAGTNSHSGQGSGGTVGTHQNATYVPDIYVAAGGTVLVTPNVDSTFSGQDAQSSLTTGYKTVTLSSGSTTSIPKTYATRPTNTSVNYIIKALEIALPTDFADAVDNKIAGFVKYGTTTGTSTSSGNVVASTSLPVSSMTIISAWCDTQGTLVIPSNNSGNWAFHVCYWGADMQAASAQSLAIRYAYIDK